MDLGEERKSNAKKSAKRFRKLEGQNLSNRKIAEILKINRNKVNRIMKELCQ